MKRYLMKCNHVNNAKTFINDECVPCCAICGCVEVKQEIIEKTDGLEGRKAECSYCDTKVPSNWNLPFFEYRPDKETDKFYCGCFGWD